MAQGVGLGFNIPTELLDRLDKADAKLEKIAQHSETTATSLKKLANEGFGTLIGKLDSMVNALNKINGTQIGDVGLNKVAAEATNSADAIARIGESLNKINSRGEIKNNAIVKITEEIEIAKKRLEELQGKLNFYAKGEGSKALGFLDSGTKSNLNAYQEEADQLMRKIPLLEREKKLLQENAWLKLDSSKTQEEIDNAWYAMEREKKERERQSAEEANRNAKQSIEAYKQSYNERYRAYEEMFKPIEQRERQLQSYMRSFRYSHTQRTGDTTAQATAAYNRLFSGKGNMSLNNMESVLSKLQDAQRKLNHDTEEGRKKYEQLAAMIRRVQQRINEATGASERLNGSHRNLINTGDQLMRKFALIFSVSQIQGYIDKLVQVRGEFELQQRALQSILQNKAEANKIWQQTVDLAVRSPFRVGELVKYTKQLAAYRIETDKLHDTTKRLADVSAGLGVDMSRLILAYGQVRAAEYLRGTELRQFTEAGIPMLEELAKHFTALRGETVSTAEVFGMISKRMVSFEDVAAVFQKMTDAGGVFYNMQEIQAETLKGQISNLHDSIDLMLNDIGKANEGTLKGGVQVAKFFVENWESVVNVMKGVIAALIGLKLYQLAARESIMLTAISQGVLTNANQKQLTSLQLLQVGWNKLTGAVSGASAALKSVVVFNAPLLAITAIIGGIVELISTSNEHKKQIAEINKEYDDLLSKSNRVAVNFRYATTGGDFDKQKAELMQLVNIANNDYNMNIHIDLEGLSKEDVEEKFGELRNQILQLNAFQREFKLKLQQASEWTLQDDITEDLQQYGNAATALMNNFHNNIHDIVYNLQQNFEELSESEKEALAILEKPIQPDETELEYLERVRGAYDKLLKKNFELLEAKRKNNTLSNAKALKEERKRLDDLGVGYHTVANLILDYDKKLEAAEEKINNLFSTIDINEHLPKEKKELLVKTTIDEQGWNEFTTEMAYRLANQKWSLEISVNEKPKEEDWKKWQEEYNKYIKTLEGKLREATPKSERFTLAKQLSDQYQEYNKIIKAYKAGAKEITKEEFAYAEKKAKSYNLAYKWLTGEGINEKGKKDGKGKDWWLEMIKGIQSLHKEFLTLNKDLNDVDAKQLAIKKHSGMFDEIKQHLGAAGNAIDINTIDFANENAFVKFLEGLKEIPNLSAQAKLAIEKALTDIKGESEVRFEVENTERIKREIADMFGNYEMSLELEKLNIPPDLAKQLFGIESLDLSSLRNKILDKAGLSSLKGRSNEEIYNSSAFKALSNERQKAVKDGLEKEEELERKAQEDRLKKYVKYLQKAQDARVKIKLEELRQIAEVEKEDRFSSQQKEDIKKALQRETKKAIDKQTWEDFTGSAFYIEIFRDLENTSTEAIKVMRERLLALKDSLGDQSPEQLKAMVEQLEKMDDELTKRQNPFKQLSGNLKEYFEYLKKSKQLNEDFIDSQDKIRRLELNRDSLSNEVAVAEQRWKAEVKISGVNSDQSRLLQQEYIIQKNLLNQTLQRLVAEGKISEELARQIREGQTAGNKAGQNIQTIGSYFNEFGSGVTEIAGNLENVFGSMSDSMRDTVESIAEIANGVGNTVSGIGRVVANPADIGGYIQALGGLTSTIGAIFNTRDKSLERQIQNTIEYVEKLERAYQRLEKRIKSAYSAGWINSNYADASKNIQSQINSYESMIAFEDEKKKTDQDKIREWKNEIEDLTEQLSELEQQRIEALGGFGSEANYKSAAEEFASAWFDAYREVGDGISGLEDTFDEFINNVVKKQLLIRGSQQLLQPLLAMIDNAVNDGMVTTTEMAGINKEWNDKTKDALNEYYKAIYDMYDGMIAGAGELSDLQRGIQSITEPQAAAIEAYLNSVRTFVSDSNATLKNIYNAINVSTSTPIMGELRQQTELIRSINENIGSVIGRGRNGIEGAYIKVLAH